MDAMTQQLLLGLGGRLLSAGGNGMNLGQGLGAGILGGLQDYGNILQQSRATAANQRAQERHDFMMDQARKDQDLADKRRERIASIMQNYGGGVPGLDYNQVPSQIAPTPPALGMREVGDAFLPSAAYTPATQPDMQGLAGAMQQEAVKQMAESGDAQGLAAMFAPQDPDLAGPIKEFTQARNMGLIPQTMSLPEYQASKRIRIQEKDKTLSLSDLANISSPVPGQVPPLSLLDKTAKEAHDMGYTLSQKAMPMEGAGKISSLNVALSELPELDKLLFKNPNEVNRDSIWGMTAINMWEPLAAFTDEDTQQLSGIYERGIQAITRTETGAAMPWTEVVNTRRRFVPKPWESAKVIRQKRIAYELFMRNVNRYTDPNREKTGNWSVDYERAMYDAKQFINDDKKDKSKSIGSYFGG